MTHHAKTSHCLWRSHWAKPRFADRQLIFPPRRDSEAEISRLIRIRGQRWWGTRISDPLLRCQDSARMQRWQIQHVRTQPDPANTRDRRYWRSLIEMVRKREQRKRWEGGEG